MELYWNEGLQERQPREESVRRAVERLGQEDGANLELRRDAASWMRVTYRKGAGYMMDVQDGSALFGLLVPESEPEAVAAALVEFKRGAAPRLPWELLSRSRDGLLELVAGEDEEHDCPLCALLAAEGA